MLKVLAARKIAQKKLAGSLAVGEMFRDGENILVRISTSVDFHLRNELAQETIAAVSMTDFGLYYYSPNDFIVAVEGTLTWKLA